jgi:hypothetical protein
MKERCNWLPCIRMLYPELDESESGDILVEAINGADEQSEPCHRNRKQGGIIVVGAESRG